jgi:sporulation protein YlmC with PRC-barrel domain
MGTNKIPRLVKLIDSHLTMADPTEDLTGFRVLDRSGEEIGVVDEFLIDESEQRVHFLQVACGGFLGIGARKFLIPVEAIALVGQQTVHLDATPQEHDGAPIYEPRLVDAMYAEPSFEDSVYGYPGYPVATRRSGMWTTRLSAPTNDSTTGKTKRE